LTKKDLIELVAKKANLTNKASRDAVSATLNGIRDSLKKGEKRVLVPLALETERKDQEEIQRPVRRLR